MASKPKKTRKIQEIRVCCLRSCSNNNRTNPDMTFVPLPNPKTHREKLLDWLELIGRTDLLKYEAGGMRGLFVCQSHFGHVEINQELRPCLNLPRAPGRPRPTLEKLSAKSTISIYNYFTENLASPHFSPLDFKDYCMNLYQCSALQYKSLAESLKLLPLGVLQQHCRRVVAESGPAPARLLHLRARHLPQRQRDCTLSIGAMDLEPGFYYDIRMDKLVGVDEVTGSTAHVAVLGVLQGLRAEWRLPLARMHLAALEPRALADWLGRVVAALPRHELQLHALVAPLAPAYYEAARLCGLTDTDPNVTFDYLKVCFFFDPTSIMQNVRYHLMRSNILFKDKEVKWEHIVQYFNLNRTFKVSLTPGLSESKVGEDDGEGIGSLAALRRPVARALSVLSQLGALPAAAAHTADFLAGVNNLCDLCSSRFAATSNPRKRPYEGQASQKQHLDESLRFLDEIVLYNPDSNPDQEDNFINAFKNNMKSIQNMYENLKEKNVESLPTRRISDCTSTIVKQITATLERRGRRSLTAHNFIWAFNGVFVTHYMRPSNLCASRAVIEKFLGLLEGGLAAFKPTGGVVVGRFSRSPLVVAGFYRGLRLPRTRPAHYLAGFLLAASLTRHQKCPKFRNYVQECCVVKGINDEDSYTVEDHWNGLNVSKQYVVKPPAAFLAFLQRLEMVFQAEAAVGLWSPLEQLEAATSDVTLRAEHCACFPVFFAKLLFLRVRLALALRHSNAVLRRGTPRGSFSSEGLYFNFQETAQFKLVLLLEDDE